LARQEPAVWPVALPILPRTAILATMLRHALSSEAGNSGL